MDPRTNALDSATQDTSVSLMLDGNAVAGLLDELFGREMTVASSVCGHCGARRELGALHAYTFAPGVVLRCPDCESVVLRVTQTTTYYWLDARGAASLRLVRS